MSELNIYQRLAKITEELGIVAKGLTVGSGSYGYKAVGEVDVLNAVKPLESKYGVYSYPMNRKVVESQVLVDSKDKTKFFLRVETTYRFVNVDNPSEFVDQVSYGDGIDSLDKAPGKSMTYSDKYSLMKAYKMVTGDDPDRHHSNETEIVGKGKQDSGKLYEEVIKLNLSAEDTAKWVKYYKVNSLFDLDNEQLQFIIDRFANRLGK